MKIHCRARDLLEARTVQEKQMNARQCIANLRDKEVIHECPEVQHCPVMPPTKINVYTDGSLKNPRIRWWSLGGIGVWWPDRNLKDLPLTETEHQFTNVTNEGKGIMLTGAATGRKASSTRMELAAAIIGIAGPGAVHIGTDSASFKKKARMLLDTFSNSSKTSRSSSMT